ncbi:MAG: hypothetical protein LBE86_12645 [Gemmobacter sp.]|jgi:carbon monoxide dehydrogenase subunit G|nr:hypothetical protein [Gemmobacter sp.]
MEMENSIFIPATSDAVWQALHDPAILEKCIPGCRNITPTPKGDMLVKARISIGFINRDLLGRLRLKDESDAPRTLLMQGGVGQRVRGSARIITVPEGAGVRLSYEIRLKIEARIASLGSFLVNRTARKLGAEFFDRLARELGPKADQL